MPHTHIFSRDPNNVQAWLVGSGIASLTAALHLIKEAKVPGPNVHIIDTHKGSGGGMRISGNEEGGYFLPYECTPHFHGNCVERLLSLIPSAADSRKSVLEVVHDREVVHERDITQRSTEAPTVLRPYHHSFDASLFRSASGNGRGSLAESLFPASGIDASAGGSGKHQAAPARFVTAGRSGPEVSHHRGIQIGITQRMVLVGFMLEHEGAIDNKSIKDIFDAAFFKTEFWMLWSTT